MLIIGVFYIILITELITEKKTHSTKVHITKLNLIYLEKWEKLLCTKQYKMNYSCNEIIRNPMSGKKVTVLRVWKLQPRIKDKWQVITCILKY